jgi:hypothetical protein
MPQSTTISIGMDVHKESIAVAYVACVEGAGLWGGDGLHTILHVFWQRQKRPPPKTPTWAAVFEKPPQKNTREKKFPEKHGASGGVGGWDTTVRPP